MRTPICDFVERYNKNHHIRFHMPGHKGKGTLGAEYLDITEISGADVLYHANGIIKESEANATALFQTGGTFYATEGSSLCIRAMLTLVMKYGKHLGQNIKIAAGRNAHKAFITGCALLDLAPVWIQGENSTTLLSCEISAKYLDSFLTQEKDTITAVYLTSPDYLGNILDIKALSEVCHQHGALLLVDNAHGAYLHYLPESIHPAFLGADLVCDSAHKTLPVLTGGAYLHISKSAPTFFLDNAEEVLMIFASTSPSYLILQSLDACNAYLAQGYQEKLYSFSAKLIDIKKELQKMGYTVIGKEPLKITVATKPVGYEGNEVADLLKQKDIYCEASDKDYVVLMLTPENTEKELASLLEAFHSIPKKEPILEFPPKSILASPILSPKEAIMANSELLTIENCIGRIVAEPSINCPPAVPIVICGEIVLAEHIPILRYYNIKKLRVMVL